MGTTKPAITQANDPTRLMGKASLQGSLSVKNEGEPRHRNHITPIVQTARVSRTSWAPELSWPPCWEEAEKVPSPHRVSEPALVLLPARLHLLASLRTQRLYCVHRSEGCHHLTGGWGGGGVSLQANDLESPTRSASVKQG